MRILSGKDPLRDIMPEFFKNNRTGSKDNKSPITRLLVISGLVVFLDQATKVVIADYLALYDTIPVIGGFFNITHILNPGGAFGLFADHSPMLRKFLFLFVSTMVACAVLWMYRKTARNHMWFSSALALIFGGAVGNLIDRFRYGKVVDFLDFYLGSYHWPAFNIADSAITIGMAIFLYHIIFSKIPDI